MCPAPSRIVDEFRRRTPKSAKLAAEARNIFPSGLTHDARQLAPYPIYVERAQGAHKWDADGQRYVDYTGGHGALLLGHNHPSVTAAVREQLALGTHYGSCHQLEVRWGQAVQRLLPSAERVRFTSSGTEATLLAMRLARAFTGRSKVMRFKGHFHGWHDHVAFGVASHFDGGVTPGVLPELTQHTVLASVDDPAETKRLIDTESDLAAVMLEPTGASWGQAPVKPELLHQLREWTAKRGVLLIFDEVISGFRVSPGGAQGAFGIKPDLTTLAKILAGGLPGGALVGRADILAPLAFPESGATSAAEKVPHHGTFNANPLSAAAGSSALRIVAESDACSRANAYAAKLREALQRTLRDAQVPWCVYGTFSGFHIFTNPQRLSVTPAEIDAGRLDYRAIKTGRDPVLLNKLRLGMLIHGVEIFSWPGGPTSAVHSGDDLDQTVAAFRDTLKMLREEEHV